MCYMEPNCVSINVKPLDGGKYNCELNNATVDKGELAFFEEVDAYYLAIKVNLSLKLKALFAMRRIQSGTLAERFTILDQHCYLLLFLPP